MVAIWGIILQQQWLLGGILSVIGSVLACAGLTCQKAAQYHLVSLQFRGECVERQPDSKRYVAPRWAQLLKLPLFWCGLLLVVIQTPVNILALSYAPQTTVLPLGAIQVLMNFVFAYGLLNERFTRVDITSTVVCILATAVMNSSMPSNIPGYMEDFPYDEALKFCLGLTSNTGFAAYLLVWLALFATCGFMLVSITEAKPLALPILVGLFTSQFNFLAKVAGTLVFQASSKPAIWESQMTYRVLFLVLMLYGASVYMTCEGLRHLAARYFLPASFVSIYALTVIQGLLFFREWENMTNINIAVFSVACFVSLVGVNYISSEHKVIHPPNSSPLKAALLRQSEDTVAKHQSILEIMEEYRFFKAQPAHPRRLEVLDMTVPFKGTWRLLPIFITISTIALPVLLWQVSYVFSAFFVLTVYAVYNGWKMGMHIAVFAYVGCKKVAHYDRADFHELYLAQAAGPSPPATWPPWEDVVHFVILPNYKEDIEVLRLAIRSVAKSRIAARQIFLVLAMEAREEGAKEKAAQLAGEFRHLFRECLATYHPPGLPNETPGKSSNTRWAANQLFEHFMPRFKIAASHAVFTVADADSEFHSEYFAALTYHFVHAGGREDETPARYLTIWQPPILHYKNYIKQPAIVRLASFVTSQHELANLADPNATRVPYSTYSISAELARAVNGWDPDWISEDWHMALKCFLATAGRLNVAPIFLPILNYSPEGENLLETLSARWAQAKRHALGFSELVFYHDHFPRILNSVSPGWTRFRLIWRAFFLWFKLLMIHLVMATFWIVGPFNGMLIAWFVKHEQPQDLNINSWTFLLNCVCQSVSFLSFISVFFVSVVLYESVKDRVDGSDDAHLSLRWRSPIIHSITVLVQSMAYLPIFFSLAAVAEWIAALKSARTHKFHYEVALKPNLSKDVMRGN